MLAEFDIPATIYVPSRIIDGDACRSTGTRSPPPALSWDDVGELVARRPRRRAVAHAHPSAAAAGRRRSARTRRSRARSARSRQHVPYALTSFCYPAGLYGAREVEFVRERRLRGGGDDESRASTTAAATCSSCAARSSTAPTTCARSGPSSTACSTARRCCGERCTHVARGGVTASASRAPASLEVSGRDRAPATERRLNMRMPTEPTPTTPAPRAGVAVRAVAARAAY